ncbi:MAG: hypothetical protein M0007_09360 [Actinomycetota bacterium]|nr:hypothetical protein [Actinomycetota bacterium]
MKPTFGVSIETTGPDCKVDRIVAVAVFNPSDVLSVVGSNEHRLLDHLYRFLHSVPAGVLATGDGGRFEAPFIVSRSRRAGMDRTWFRQVVDVAGTERLARDDRSTGAVYQLAVESASPDVYLSPTTHREGADHAPFDLSRSGARSCGPIPRAVGDGPIPVGTYLSAGEQTNRNLARAALIYDAAVFSAAVSAA